MIPRIAIRTINLEKVRLELKLIRFAMKKGKFNPEMVFFIPLAKMHFFKFVSKPIIKEQLTSYYTQ